MSARGGYEFGAEVNDDGASFVRVSEQLVYPVGYGARHELRISHP